MRRQASSSLQCPLRAVQGWAQLLSGASVTSIWNVLPASLIPPSILFGNPFSTNSSRSSLNLIIPSPCSHSGGKSCGRLPQLCGPLFIYAKTIPSKFLQRSPSPSPPNARTSVPVHSLPSRTSPLQAYSRLREALCFPSHTF